MIAKRIISALVGIIILIFVVNSNKILVNAAVAIVSIIALNELFSAVNKKMDVKLPGWWAYIGSAVVSFRLYMDYNYFLAYIFFSVLLLFIIMILKYNKIMISHVAIMIFSLIYISFFISHIVSVKNMEHGHILVWFIFIGAWSTDTFAYTVGTIAGKHKLCPQISPKKTVEGSLGGIFGCVIAFLVYAYIIQLVTIYNVNYINLIILAVLCSVISQIGDLSASVIKRQLDVKDFGAIMPGHGGILDRFDSIIFVAPFIYYYLIIFYPVI